jgi:hypothetical protein
MEIALCGLLRCVADEIGDSSVDRKSYVAFVIEVVSTLTLSIGPNLTWNEITLESNDEPITTGIVQKCRGCPRIVPECSTALVTATKIGSPTLLSAADFNQSGDLKGSK